MSGTYCPKCGKLNQDEEARFCAYCGAALTQLVAPGPGATSTQSFWSRNKNWVLAAVIVVIVTGVTASMLLAGDSDKSSSATTVSIQTTTTDARLSSVSSIPGGTRYLQEMMEYIAIVQEEVGVARRLLENSDLSSLDDVDALEKSAWRSYEAAALAGSIDPIPVSLRITHTHFSNALQAYASGCDLLWNRYTLEIEVGSVANPKALEDMETGALIAWNQGDGLLQQGWDALDQATAGSSGQGCFG